MAAPGVKIKEIDLSTRIPNFPGVYGAMVIDAIRGPVDKPVLISNETELLRAFTLNETIPIGSSTGYYEALTFLQNSDKLWLKRVAGAGALYGGATIQQASDGTTTNGDLDGAGELDPTTFTFTVGAGAEAFLIYADSPGAWDEGIGIQIHNIHTKETIDGSSGVTVATPSVITVSDQNWVSGEAVKVRPDTGATLPTGLTEGTTYYVHVPVPATDTAIELALNQADAISGDNTVGVSVAGTGNFFLEAVKVVEEPDSFLLEVYKLSNPTEPVESFYLSRDQEKKDGFNRSIYVETTLESSEYIRALDNTAVADTEYPKSQPITLYLNGGVDGATAVTGEYQDAVEEFSSKETYPLTVIMDGGFHNAAYQNYIIGIAEDRADCVAFIGTPIAQETATGYLNNIVDWKNDNINTSSYGALYTPHVTITDKFNDRDITIGPSGFAGGALSSTAFNYEAWYAPAGDIRGAVNGKDVNIRLTNSDMDFLYLNYINPIRYSPTKGIAIYGQKTLINRPSSLDRLNVRLLITVIQPSIATLLENFLFEFNDTETRAILGNKIESFLEGVKARQGLFDFRVIVDDSNNTDQDIANNILNIDVYIKPNQATEFVNFTTIVTGRDVSFELAESIITG